MVLARGGYSSRTKDQYLISGDEIESEFDTYLVIKLPDSKALRIMSRLLLVAMILFAFPFIRSIAGERGGEGSLNAISESGMKYVMNGNRMMLPIVFHDLIEEGLLEKGQKGLIVVDPSIDVSVKDLDFLNQNGIEYVIGYGITDKMVINEAFDFMFVSSLQDGKAVDRIVKTDGIVISSVSYNPSNEVQQPANYRIVYLRRFEHSIITAMRKIGFMHGLMHSSGRRILSAVAPDTKKAALSGLEDAMLEPPRSALKKLNKGSRRIKFLPDLLKDSLETYPRRVFISDGKNGVIEWFKKNYPTKNQDFEVYNMEIEMYDPKRPQTKEAPKTGVSDWLRNNVKEEDYVVMKAEATVVEEIIRQRNIRLVDELFLECKHQWEDGEDENLSKRAYWQCLSLYGRLRDEGIAVHQWWS